MMKENPAYSSASPEGDSHSVDCAQKHEYEHGHEHVRGHGEKHGHGHGGRGHVPGSGFWRRRKGQTGFSIFLRRFLRQKMALACFIVLVALIAICAFAPLIAPYDMATMDLTAISQSPSADHLFGTDDLGRDIFSRCLYGGRYSLAIGFLSTALALVIGIVIGACSAYFGGMADLILMRVLDLLSAMPSILLAIAISAVLGTGFDKLLIALSISAIVPYARQLRAKMLAVSQMEYVEAARAINCSIPRIMFIHVFPNAMTPVIVAATMGVAQQILSAATLAYIGLGVRPPSPEWGAMLAAAKTYIIQYPYMLIGPGVLIVISVLCINLVGDGIRDALDPKMKR